jgi:hypothetical protein
VAGAGDEPAPLQNDGNPAAPRAGIAVFHSEEASQNSRNSEEAEWPANAEARGDRSQQDAISANAEVINGESCSVGEKVECPDGVAAEGDSVSESASQNSQNGPMPPHPARPGSDGALPSRGAETTNRSLHLL